MKIEKVTLIGLGSMGAFFAPNLYESLGKNFRVLATGKRKERLQTKGVTINGVNYIFNIIEPSLKNDPADLIIISVKDTGLDQAIKDIENQVGENTQILCVLNGIDSEQKVAAVYGWEHVLYSYMRVSIGMKDGVADFDPDFGQVLFGEAKNDVITDRVQDIKNFFDACGINYVVQEDMIRGLWFKFMCNIGENMTCALLGVPFGAFRVSDHANEIRRRAMWEVVSVANKLGIDLGKQDIEGHEKTIGRLPFDNKPSTLQDIESLKPTEVEMFAGTMVKLGKQLDIETPVCWMFYHGIKVLEEKNEGKFKSE